MTLDESLQLIEDGVRRLKIEYDIFFSGVATRPPYDLRNRVDSLLKRVSEEKKMSLAQRYRYNTLMARYSSYRDLWRRVSQDKELGITTQSRRESTRARVGAGSTRAAEATGPYAGQDVSETAQLSGSAAEVTAISEQSFKIQISDVLEDVSEVQKLFDFLAVTKSRLGDKKILSFESFCSLIKAKTDKLKEDKSCKSVTFNVSVEGDKLRFTAKAGGSS
ncbi:MAG: hypothetical protein HYR55_07215 [Acidobacteria bacterium]|nr:hypothetical protein [Acidobacteriota bacterium]MBI3658266.1 hypothetical protein [Acidobacteriota bacterium]